MRSLHLESQRYRSPRSFRASLKYVWALCRAGAEVPTSILAPIPAPWFLPADFRKPGAEAACHSNLKSEGPQDLIVLRAGNKNGGICEGRDDAKGGHAG